MPLATAGCSSHGLFSKTFRGEDRDGDRWGHSVDGFVFRRAGRDVAGQGHIRLNRPFGPWDPYR